MKIVLSLISLVMVTWVGAADAMDALTPPAWWPHALNSAKKEGYRLITPGDLKTLQESGKTFLLLDVRPGYEFCQGHLPNAVNLPVDLGDRLSLSTEKKHQFIKTLGNDPNRWVVIYCRSFR